MITFYKTIEGRMAQLDGHQDGCWVSVVGPSEEELTLLSRDFGIDSEFLHTSLDEEESSHIESEDDQTLIVIDVPYAEKAEENILYTTMPVGIIIMPNTIVTVALRENPVLRELSDGMVRAVNTTLRTQFVLHLLLRMASRFLQYLKNIDKNSSSLEKQLRKSMRNKELVQLLDLEKSLVYIQTSLKSNEVTVEKILRGRFVKLYDEDQDLLGDVLIEIKQAIEMANIYLSILSNTMDAFASVISNNLNIVMKIMTTITILLSIPTMIFSFYGMNIGMEAGLPFSGSFWFPMILSAVITGTAGYILFRKGMF